MYGPAPWSVEFAEIDSLPCAQGRLSRVNGYCHARSHHARLDVSGGVAFQVGIPILKRHNLIQLHDKIPLYGGIGGFINCDAGRCVWDIHMANPGLHTR